jgi:hypothetical protein
MNQLNILKIVPRRIIPLLAMKTSFSMHTFSKNLKKAGITQFVMKPCYSFGNIFVLFLKKI